ncbi:MAG: hypothetical protein ACRDNK_03305 [Solirubrobacteraceae bacterium]
MPVAPAAEQLEELDAETRLAWSSYSERLREVSGDEYERLEPEFWDELQAELRRLESERESLVTPGTEVSESRP